MIHQERDNTVIALILTSEWESRNAVNVTNGTFMVEIGQRIMTIDKKGIKTLKAQIEEKIYQN